jgi:soluble cytochrome b562
MSRPTWKIKEEIVESIEKLYLEGPSPKDFKQSMEIIIDQIDDLIKEKIREELSPFY